MPSSMTFNAFLGALLEVLTESSPCQPDPRSVPARSRVVFDPGRLEAASTDQVLLGLGQWQHA